ncbi:hypothetical protein CCAL6883_00205 [Campylobacter sp. RM6883]|nr:hypothetical protein [Campylobacter sp. RM6883]
MQKFYIKTRQVACYRAKISNSFLQSAKEQEKYSQNKPLSLKDIFMKNFF